MVRDWLETFLAHARETYEAPIFADRRQAVAHLARSIVLLVRDEGVGLDAEQRRDAASLLLRRRFPDIIV